MKILLADDNAIARKALAAGLAAEGYTVELAEDGEQALSLLKHNQPDFVISDILMPNMDGYSLCQAIRKDKRLRHIPVVFYSSTFLEPEDEALARSVGATGFIHNDRDPESFQRQLKDILLQASNDGTAFHVPVVDDVDDVQRRHESVLVRKLTSKIEELEAEKQALRDSREFLDQILTTIPDVVFVLQLPEGRLKYIAPDPERLIGYSHDEVMADAGNWLRFVHEEDRESVSDALQRAVDSMSNRVVVCRMYHKQGGCRLVEARVSIRPNAQQEPDEVVGVLTDITQRSESEALLRESERSLKTLFGNLPGMAYRCENSRDWPMHFISDGVKEMTGYRRDELEQNRLISYGDLIHPDDSERVWRDVQEGLKERRQFSTTYRIRHKDGSLRWVWERGVGVRDDATGEQYIEGFISDITVRRQAEERLIVSERRFRSLFEMMQDGMALHELVYEDGTAVDFRYLDVNPAFERISGLKAGQIIGKRARELFPEVEPSWIEEYIEVGRSGGSASFVRYYAESHRYFRVIAYQTQADQFATIIADITEQRRAEEEIHNLARFPQENPSPVLRLDREGGLIYANPASKSLILQRYDEDEVTVPEVLRHHAVSAFASDRIERVEFSTHNRHYSFVLAPVVESGYINLYGRDITGMVHTSEQLKRMNRVLRTLSKGNRTLVHARSEEELLESLCRALTREGSYPFVWVACSDDEGGMLPIVYGGQGEATLYAWLEMLRGYTTLEGLLAALPELDTPLAINQPQPAGWSREVAHALLETPYGSMLMLPIDLRGKQFGVIGIFADSNEIFDETERNLLHEMAGDVAYGIQALRTKSAHERSLQRLNRAMMQTVEAVSITLEMRDPYTAGHQQRVVQLAEAIAEEMGLPKQRIEGLKLAAIVHDIGKIHIPAEILNRPGRLTESEFGIIKSHPQVGYDILKGVEFDWPIADIVLQHHERCDGSGYPQGLTCEEILPEARILAVADVVEAITSHRPYRPGLGIEMALEEIETGRGSRYDAEVVDCCLRLFREKGFVWEEEYSLFPDHDADTVRSDAH